MAIVIFAWAGMAVLSILSLALTQQPLPDLPPEFADAGFRPEELRGLITAIQLIFAAIAVGLGMGLWKLQKWARVAMLAVAFLLIFLYAISTLVAATRGADSLLLMSLLTLGFFGWAVWYLRQPHVKQAFAGAPPPTALEQPPPVDSEPPGPPPEEPPDQP